MFGEKQYGTQHECGGSVGRNSSMCCQSERKNFVNQIKVSYEAQDMTKL